MIQLALKQGHKRFQGTLNQDRIRKLAVIVETTEKSYTELLGKWIDTDYLLVTQWNKKITTKQRTAEEGELFI
ncbi:hypothetical protein FG877_10930 [Enterococcus casseliflavus]|uniref:hypothetical protein n=1 Tax=unclassified Enterococcus TaxID=2608891 RepID=UPI001C701D46|nr:hypothetical protein [Enterococcus casseliflavus]